MPSAPALVGEPAFQQGASCHGLRCLLAYLFASHLLHHHRQLPGLTFFSRLSSAPSIPSLFSLPVIQSAWVPSQPGKPLWRRPRLIPHLFRSVCFPSSSASKLTDELLVQ